MNFEEPDFRAAFFAIHSDLPREAPGSDATTRRALDLVRADLPSAPRVLDAGCGPGAASAVLLAELPQARLRAVDTHPPFVEAARARVATLGAADRFEGAVADMGAETGPFDLIWCEGAIYNLGVESALRVWRGALAPGRRVVFSDAVWLTDAPDPEAVEMWRAYPGMTDAAGLDAAVARAGFAVVGGFLQPESDWDAYMDALEGRLAALDAAHGKTEGGRAALAETREEIALWRRCPGQYGYRLLVAAPA
ncbi:MAG: class I SAM-dependent methyltransferase [Paracoccaceae bacterium]